MLMYQLREEINRLASLLLRRQVAYLCIDVQKKTESEDWYDVADMTVHFHTIQFNPPPITLPKDPQQQTGVNRLTPETASPQSKPMPAVTLITARNSHKEPIFVS